jgi:hypothetical protein
MQSTTSPPTPAYNTLLARIEWLENGQQAPSLGVDLKELLAALSDMQDNGRKHRQGSV